MIHSFIIVLKVSIPLRVYKGVNLMKIGSIVLGQLSQALESFWAEVGKIYHDVETKNGTWIDVDFLYFVMLDCPIQ